MVSTDAARAAIATENLNDNAVRALSVAQEGLSIAIEEVSSALGIRV